jgi:hypothetical protein
MQSDHIKYKKKQASHIQKFWSTHDNHLLLGLISLDYLFKRGRKRDVWTIKVRSDISGFKLFTVYKLQCSRVMFCNIISSASTLTATKTLMQPSFSPSLIQQLYSVQFVICNLQSSHSRLSVLGVGDSEYFTRNINFNSKRFINFATGLLIGWQKELKQK